MGGEQVVAMLRRVELLRGLPDDTLAELAHLGAHRSFAAREYVVRQTEYGDSFFVILRGGALVELIGDDGRSRKLGSLEPGDYFGELALLGHGERSASVRTTAATNLLELERVPFQAACRRHPEVKARLERAYAERALFILVRRSQYLGGLPEETLRELVEHSALTDYKKGALIVQEDAPAQRFHVIRSGFVRVSRRRSDGPGEEILAYLGPGDFFGDQELTSSSSGYQTTVTALEPAQLMEVPRASFWRIQQQHPDLFSKFRRYEVSRRGEQSLLRECATSMAFVKDVLEAGLGQARSALIVDMDRCVRCGACVQACHDLHGFTRLARRGKRMTRRTRVESPRHEHLYFPTSCIQCATPECMVGCRTGAISRDLGGEVFIRDTCVGCGVCARSCDFGNISMVEPRDTPEFSLLSWLERAKESSPAEAVASRKPRLLATKCDVCFEREFAACVYNCPTQALLRVDPRSYFEELRKVAPVAPPAASIGRSAKTTTRPPSRWVDPTVQLGALVLSVVFGLQLLHGRSPDLVRSSVVQTGVASAVVFALLGALGVRKRLRQWALGRLFLWTRAHALLGGLFAGLVLFHANYAAHSVLTIALLGSVVFITLTGIGGQIVGAVVPPLLSRSQEESLLPEDVETRVVTLERENRDLLATVNADERRRIGANVSRLAHSGVTCLLRGFDPSRLEEIAEARAKKLRPLTEKEHTVAIRVSRNLMSIRLYRSHGALESLLGAWLPLHMVGAAVAGLLLVGHVLAVLLW